jgi:hypothetical protein
MNLIPALAIGLLIVACEPSRSPSPPNPEKPQDTKVDVAPLRRALGNIQSYLGDLEARLTVSRAETWRLEASAAEHALGNIRMEIDALKRGALNVNNLESWLIDLEGRLRGAGPDNWRQNSAAARSLVGNVRIEIQNLRRALKILADAQ